MLSDIEIASQKVMRPVLDIAHDLGIAEDELDLYGRYKAKLDDTLYERLADRPDGRPGPGDGDPIRHQPAKARPPPQSGWA